VSSLALLLNLKIKSNGYPSIHNLPFPATQARLDPCESFSSTDDSRKTVKFCSIPRRLEICPDIMHASCKFNIVGW